MAVPYLDDRWLSTVSWCLPSVSGDMSGVQPLPSEYRRPSSSRSTNDDDRSPVFVVEAMLNCDSDTVLSMFLCARSHRLPSYSQPVSSQDVSSISLSTGRPSDSRLEKSCTTILGPPIVPVTHQGRAAK